MTTLATIFDDAFLREKERYRIDDCIGGFEVIKPTNVIWCGVSGTRADCERFIHQRARAAGFAALREAARFDDSLSEEQYLGVHDFLASLAGDGDAGKGE